jgi:magnesium transporter
VTEYLNEEILSELEISAERKHQIAAQITSFLNNGRTKEAQKLIKKSHIADIADIIEVSPDAIKKSILNLLGEDFDPHILAEIADNTKLSVLHIIGKEQFINKVNQLPIDAAADVIYGLNEKFQHKILKHLSEEKRSTLLQGLAYKEDTAGRIMNSKMIAVPSYWTVRATLDYLKTHPNLSDDFYEIFIVDPKNKPIGSILTSRLLRTNEDKLIVEIMNRQIKVIKATDTKEDVIYLFKHYALVSTPVVTEENRLIGQIVIDDVIEIIEEEVEEDIMKLSGIGKKIMMPSPALSSAIRRLPWLFINLCTAFFTSSVINNFSATIQKLVLLAAIMPIVASLGGNAGTQSLTVSVRGLANRKIHSLNYLQVIMKEMLASLLNGSVIAILGGGFIAWLYHDIRLGLMFGMAVIVNFSVAGFFGSFIPITMKKIGLDPALGSGVILTAMTDTTGFFTFLGLATLILQ